MTNTNTTITTDRKQRIKKTTSIHFNMEWKKALAELRDGFTDTPAGMNYFYGLFENYRKPAKISGKRKKVIAFTCLHVPVEIVYALDAIPVRICSGAHATDHVGAESLPAKSCPMVKSTLGALSTGLLPHGFKPDLVVNTASCDQKKKLGEIPGFEDTPFYLLEVPSTKDSEEARQYWQRAVKKLVKKLELVTEKKLSRRKLKNAIKKVAKAQQEYRRFNTLRKKAPVIYGKDALMVTNAFFFDDIERWTQNLALLSDELEQRIIDENFVTRPNAPRILLTGSPPLFPNVKVPVMIERLGGLIASEEFCSGSRMLNDTVAVDEWFLYDMVPAVADRYLKPSTCPNFSPNDDRLRKILLDTRENKIDGVVYITLTGCQLYDMESRRVGKALEEAEIHTLFLETDYGPEDLGQLSTRLEAFFDAIKYSKT